MAQLGQTFDANTVEPSAPREILPPGKYNAQIVRSEMKETSTGGKMLVLEMEIIDGEHANRHVWDRLNLVNANSKTVEIAQQTLSAICHATGQLQVSDSEQLHMKPVTITLAVKPADGKYGPSNDVKGYEAMQTGSSAQRPAVATAAKPAANAVATPPWRRTAAA